MTTKSQTKWVELRIAADRLDVPPGRVKALVRGGLIRVRPLPGVRAKYNAEDVDRLAALVTAPPPAVLIFQTTDPEGDGPGDETPPTGSKG